MSNNDIILEPLNHEMEQLLTGRDVACILKVSRAYAYRLMQLGEIRTVRIGRLVRVRPYDLEYFIATNLTNQ